MVLFIGGAFQGKKKAASEYLDKSGKTGMVSDFHMQIREAILAGEDPDELTRRLLKAYPAVVTMDEVGYGIVPMEKVEREYREAVGRAGQLLAAEAEEVYRVVCGVSVRIKGNRQET